MENIELIIESKLQSMILKYPEQEELSIMLFSMISEMFQEDFELIASKNKKLKMVFDAVINIIEKAKEGNAKKQYTIDILNMFLGDSVVQYLSQKLENRRDDYVAAIKSARAELYCSQWSDTDSNHWERALKCLDY